ncbi:MAG: lipopolysaccharide heptosyltransferase II [Ignavibacteriales bacterium]|nr:lipopolysaccharide heptosyltransferase II [Ignavibacteriales bacterium]
MKKNVNDDLKNIKKILVVQTAFIGDVILVTPLLRALNDLFPNSQIDIMVTPQTSNILNNNPNINSIIIFDKKKNKLKASLKVLRQLKLIKYDIVFTPHSSITTAILIFLAGIPIRVGFDRWSARWLLTHKVKHLANVHKIKKILNLLSPFTDREYSMQTELFPTKEMIENALSIVGDLKLNSKKLIALAPGSNWFTKRWPKEYYKQLAEKLNKLNFGLIFIGSKDEENLCEEIKPDEKSINLAGKLSLLESAAVVELCDIMICNDSGALHIADAVKTDVISFFGPTVKSIGYFPYRENDKVLEVELDCRPCSSHGTNKCPLEHHNCMKMIEPDFVVQEVIKRFS